MVFECRLERVALTADSAQPRPSLREMDAASAQLRSVLRVGPGRQTHLTVERLVCLVSLVTDAHHMFNQNNHELNESLAAGLDGYRDG
jgi:hypothetical protein